MKANKRVGAGRAGPVRAPSPRCALPPGSTNQRPAEHGISTLIGPLGEPAAAKGDDWLVPAWQAMTGRGCLGMGREGGY